MELRQLHRALLFAREAPSLSKPRRCENEGSYSPHVVLPLRYRFVSQVPAACVSASALHTWINRSQVQHVSSLPRTEMKLFWRQRGRGSSREITQLARVKNVFVKRLVLFQLTMIL